MNTINQQTIYTVTKLTQSIKEILEKEYKFIRISGEVSNLKTPYSGHSYFSLKDSSAQIRAVLFKQQKRFVDLDLANGQQVICFGRVTVYEPRGDYQLIVDSVELFGRGQLQRAFEQLKADLSSKGYFDQSRKKEIPHFPRNIAVVTSPTGAAFQDFIKIFKLRGSPVSIQLFPVRVQGERAANEISRAIGKLSEQGSHDVVVLCRGGGSLEDLWAFNEREVAEAIFSSNIPIVTGVGHEIDFTIADFCADLRSPTPTAAAEFLALDASNARRQIDTLLNLLHNRIQDKISFSEQQLHHLSKMLGVVTSTIKDAEHRLVLSKAYLIQTIVEKIQVLQTKLERQTNRILAQSPHTQIALQNHHVEQLYMSLSNSILRTIEKKQSDLGKLAALLNGVSPLATLARGYSITRQYSNDSSDYQVITKSKDVSPGENINILLHEGELDCTVIKTRKN